MDSFTKSVAFHYFNSFHDKYPACRSCPRHSTHLKQCDAIDSYTLYWWSMQVHRNVNITPPTPHPTLTWRSINFMMQVHRNVNITPPTPHPTLTWRSINLMSCQHHAYDFIRGKAKTCIFQGAVPTTWEKQGHDGTTVPLILVACKPKHLWNWRPLQRFWSL